MANVLPRTRLQKIEWFEQRLDGWLADPAAIGLTPAQVTQLAADVAAARQAYDRAQQTRNEAQSATVGFHAASAAMEGGGRDLITTIKAFAEASNDPGVYVQADVPPPNTPTPTPTGPPDTPTHVTGTINSDGAVELSWQGSLRHRTFFEILRRLEGEASWTVLDSVGAKRYLDETVPLGTTAAQYRVRAKRGNHTSPANDPITVRLGVEPQTGNTGLNLAA